MRALTLTQPWAQLMADGRKLIETRSWRPPFTLRKGEVFAIHAAKGWRPEDALAAFDWGYDIDTPGALPRGAIVALVEFRGCYPIELFEVSPEFTAEEATYGDYSPGRFGWVTRPVLKLDEPIACRGALGLWHIPNTVEEKIDAARKVLGLA